MTAPNVIAAYMDRETYRYFAEQCRLARQGQDIPETAPPEPQFPRPHLDRINADKPVLRLSYVVWGITAALWAYPAAMLVAWIIQTIGGLL